MKYLVLAKSKDNPATRYRVAPIVKKLLARGDTVDINYEPGFLSQLRILFSADAYDLVYIQRKLFGPGFIKLLSRRRGRIVFDHDDAIFLKSDGSRSNTRTIRYNSVVKAADLVLAGNSYLVDEAATHANRVEQIPTCVDTERYQAITEKPDRINLVWIGSRSTARYLENHRAVFEAIGAKYPELQLKVIGDFEFTLNNLHVENITWSSGSEVQSLCESHIGVAPMADDPWTRGKCALKVIQYMAAGLPVVSDSVGANKEVIEHGVTGYLANNEGEWIDAIAELVHSSDQRTKMGNAGRRVAQERYAIEQVANRVISFLDQIAIK